MIRNNMMPGEISLKRWLTICLFNLWIVALLGSILRAKILFSIPFIDQQFFLHAHSHFAFTGWVSQVLMVLLVAYLSRQSSARQFSRYNAILAAHLVAAYGMIITFPLQGYGTYSIIFSMMSIVVSFIFGIKYWKDLNRLPVKQVSHHWFKAAIVFNLLSSLGTFSLAYMMANKIVHQHLYLASVYFYLHFQYNGWFFFVCMGLLCDHLLRAGISQKYLFIIFLMFAFSCFPAYFLSALWLPIPLWVYILVVAAALAEAIAWFWLAKLIIKNVRVVTGGLQSLGKWLLGLSALALTVKLLLQVASTIPSLSQLAYGFRPIVIAYLHLVLLGVITLFILGYIFAKGFLHVSRTAVAGAVIFAGGILFNEIVLMLQGIAAMDYEQLPLTNQMLFGIALVMFTGTGILAFSQLFKVKEVSSGSAADYFL